MASTATATLAPPPPPDALMDEAPPLPLDEPPPDLPGAARPYHMHAHSSYGASSPAQYSYTAGYAPPSGAYAPSAYAAPPPQARAYNPHTGAYAPSYTQWSGPAPQTHAHPSAYQYPQHSGPYGTASAQYAPTAMHTSAVHGGAAYLSSAPGPQSSQMPHAAPLGGSGMAQPGISFRLGAPQPAAVASAAGSPHSTTTDQGVGQEASPVRSRRQFTDGPPGVVRPTPPVATAPVSKSDDGPPPSFTAWLKRSQARYPSRPAEVRAKMKSVLTPLVDNGTWKQHDWDREPIPVLDSLASDPSRRSSGSPRRSSGSPRRSSPGSGRRRGSPGDDLFSRGNKRNAGGIVRPQMSKKARKAAAKQAQQAKQTAVKQPAPRPMSAADKMSTAARAARFQDAARPTRRAADDDDDDWSSAGVIVQARCQELEKPFLRLNGPPEASKVRPEPVIRAALERLVGMIARGEQEYHYHWSQLKAMRQDLIVQHLQNETAAAVEEVFARRALERGDMRDYQKCSTALRVLVDNGVQGCRAEFDAYRILANVCQDHCTPDEVLKAMKDAVAHGVGASREVQHALAVQRAMSLGNWRGFWKLYAEAPHCGRLIMDRAAPTVRLAAAKTLVLRFKPAVGQDLLLSVLGFDVPARANDGSALLPGCSEAQRAAERRAVPQSEQVRQCRECLQLFKAAVASSTGGAIELRAKENKAESLVMPEEKDMKGHGHAEVKLTDFTKLAV